MMIQALSITSNPRKQPPGHGIARNNLMLAGIDQGVFLKQWGEPETQISLDCLGNFCKLGSFFLIADSTQEVRHSVWIYKKKDRILFFTRKRLTSHFKWSEFKESYKSPRETVDREYSEKSSSFVTTTLALVA
jgi:hypothetical protein